MDESPPHDRIADAATAPKHLKSLDRTFAIIERLKTLDGAGVTELAAETGFSKSSVHQHLSTLRALDLVVKDGDEYALGLRFLDLGGYVRHSRRGANIIKAKMRELGDRSGEVAIFTTEEHGVAVILYREAGEDGVYTKSRPGKRVPIHTVAAGKAILSQYSADRLAAIVERRGLPSMTERTITDVDDLRADLEATRERGFSISKGESTEGVNAVSVPMQTPAGEVLGACAVAGPSHRMKGERLESEVPDLIRSVVNEMELNIAYS